MLFGLLKSEAIFAINLLFAMPMEQVIFSVPNISFFNFMAKVLEEFKHQKTLEQFVYV